MWSWGPDNTLWQLSHTGGQFNPLAILNPTSAKLWYAQHSAANWNSSGFWNPVLAVIQDAAGGYISAWTGSPQSAAQAWWQAGIGLATIPITGWAYAGSQLTLKGAVTYMGISSAAHSAIQPLTTWQPMTTSQMASAALSVLSLGTGSLYAAGTYHRAFNVPQTGQFQPDLFNGSLGNWQTLNQISSAGKKLSFASKVKNVLNAMTMSYDQSLNSQVQQKIPTTQPPVGGVLLDRKAACNLDGMLIEGAYWDRRTNSLIMVTTAGRLLSAPAVDLDHLRVALRAAWSGEPLGVSIDPPGEYRYRTGGTVPAGAPMYVSYLGGTRGTPFGAIMFEADRVLKCLTNGVDNETGRPYNLDVPGYLSLLSRLCGEAGYRPGLWHRFWFVIDDVSLALDRKSGVLRFDTIKLKVLNECELNGQPAKDAVTTSDHDFVEHLTKHYDLYAQKVPSFARLKELASISALAQYLAQEGVSVDVSSLFSQDSVPIDTPDETPAIVASRQRGDRVISLSGGVNMEIVPTVREVVEPAAAQLRVDCEAWRPGVGTRIWQVGDKADGRVAIAMSLGRPEHPFTEFATDDGSADGFGLSRYYDSAETSDGDFGLGWRLAVPYRITPIQASRLRPETRDPGQPVNPDLDRPKVLVLHDLSSGRATRYRLTDGRTRTKVYARIRSQVKRDGGLTISEASGSTILIDAVGYRMRRRHTEYLFHADGLLSRVEHADGRTLAFEWGGSLVSSVTDENGHRYTIERDPKCRVTSVVCPDNRKLAYSYDPSGRLRSISDDRNQLNDYRYDLSGRLVEIRCGTGDVVRRAVYDDVGNMRAQSDRIAVGRSEWLERTFAEGRLMSVADSAGWKMHYQYRPSGAIDLVRLSGPRHDVVTLAYDDTGQLCRMKDGFNNAVDVLYDGDAIRQLVLGDRQQLTFHTQKGGTRWVLDQADANRWEAIFDSEGRLKQVVDAASNQVSARYGASSIRVSSSVANCRIKRRGGAYKFDARSRDQRWRLSSSDGQTRLLTSRGRLWRRRSAEMEANGDGARLRDAAGEVCWQRSPDAPTVHLTISWADDR